ncbi:MAG: carbohydrate binding family 9 domain-containing protein [Chitinophagaceae bacterium]|nr:carbohydrate binding family 9 domain-containing protein [Chitinophagaceae bacterium]
MFCRKLTWLLIMLCPLISIAQSTPSYQDQYQLHIKKASKPVKIDGVLDDAAWAEATVSSDFIRKYPNDLVNAKRRTVAKVSFDDNFIYFAFIAYDTSHHVVQSLKRDGGHETNDAVGIILDPMNQRTTGFFFVVNAFNTQTDDQLDGTSQPLSLSWDNKWFSATKRLADHWIAEIAIPFKTIRYSNEKLKWGLNFLRSDLKENEYTTWTRMPINFKSYDLGYTGSLIWDNPPPPTKGNISFIPYVTGGANEDKEDSEALKGTANAGFDAKIGLTSSLNLDLTVNPDFSQIEVDQQVTNLTRFNIFLPERRTFFLENADLFAGYGIPPIRPFYSRTIGLDNNGNRIPIYGGARISGNIASRTRIGVMNMQTGRKDEFASQNYTAVSVNQGFFKRSLFRAYFLNHQAFMTASEKAIKPMDQYGRNAGFDMNFANLKGTWSGWISHNQSWKPNINDKSGYSSFGFEHNTANFGFVLDATNVGTNYYTDMGYVQRIENYDALRDTSIRVGFKHLFTEMTYRINPKQGNILRHTFQLSNYNVHNPNNTFNENNTEFSYRFEMKNTSGVELSGSHTVVDLLFPISFTDATPIPAQVYNYSQTKLTYSSDIRKKFNFAAGVGGGTLFNGTYQQIVTKFVLRSQPLLNLSISFEYNKLKFPGNYGSTELFLIAPRAEINFSTTLFWTTFVQYNTQRNNFNINSRFQWRYKPMSDLFIVYTDNYFTDPFFKNKNRAIVFKLNYWLNL